MREDMSKQITECYRSKYGRENFKARRRSIRMMDEDALDHLPARESIRAAKELNRGFDFGENLSPLRRWLQSQAGENWDDVYSQVNAAIPAGTLGDHVMLHLDEYVSWRQVEVGGKLMMQNRTTGVFEDFSRFNKFGSRYGWGRAIFYIDQKNILRYVPRKGKGGKKSKLFDTFKIIHTPQDKYPNYSRCNFYRKNGEGAWECSVLYDSALELIPVDAVELVPPELWWHYAVPKPSCKFYLKSWRKMSANEVKSVNPQTILNGLSEANTRHRNVYTAKEKGTTDEIFRELLHRSDEKKKLAK